MSGAQASRPVTERGVLPVHRCPRCGQGRLYKGLLDVAENCESCGLDYSEIDAGDGPAVFVILFLGALVTGGALWVEVTWAPPLWVHAVLWPPIILGAAILLLRQIKTALIHQQYRKLGW